MTYRGVIKGFHGSWMSGLAQLVIERTDADGRKWDHVVPCDNGPTGRALIHAFDAAGEDHTIDNSKLEGKEIIYTVDMMGLLEAFTPAADWPGKEIPPEGLDEEGAA